MQSVDAIVVLMMENRSFDHYLGTLRSDTGYAARAMVDGLLGTESNPDPTTGNKPLFVFPTSNRTPKDPPHGWDACHAQWNGGRNDGFVKAHAGAGSERGEVMGFHDRQSIPFYYALADRFTVCDRWFASVMGPTWPNRFYLHSASSFGKKDNSPITDGKVPTVWERLRDKGMRGKNYSASLVAFYSGGYIGKTAAGTSPVTRMDEFFQNAKAGALPPFSIIDPDFLTNDDHPSHDINLGQAFMATVVQAIAQSPQWSRTLLVITYDEHGGFYDHVPPPKVPDERAMSGFDQLGFRVPTLIAGPYAKPGFVSSVQYDHTSVLAHIEKMFKLRPLSMRDTAAASLDDAIDQDRLARRDPAPPISLPPILIDAAEVEKACEQAPHLGPPSDILALADTGYFGKLDLRHRQRELLYAIGDRLEKYGMGGIRRG